ncbi:hypothetical protein Hanom_Chr10g00881051 [Helianthus anomalus]
MELCNKMDVIEPRFDMADVVNGGGVIWGLGFYIIVVGLFLGYGGFGPWVDDWAG